MDRRRVIVFLSLVIVPLGALEARLAWIQLLNPDEYAGPSRRRQSLEVAISARGSIRDAHGRVLARDERSFDLYVVLEEFEKQPDCIAPFGLDGVEKKIDEAYAYIAHLQGRRPTRESPLILRRERRTPILVARGLTFEQARAIETSPERFPGCQVRENLRRFYPYGPVGALVVGTLGRARGPGNYTGERPPNEADALLEESGFTELLDEDTIERFQRRGVFEQEYVGRSGVERGAQDRLRGRPGLMLEERDAQSGARSWTLIAPARPGEDVELTLDIDLQKAVEAIVAEMATRTTAVVMDPASGAIRALATNAPFDPNDFVRPERWRQVAAYFDESSADKPMLNRATHCALPFGSIFKIVSSAAALEEGIATPARMIECKGHFIPGAEHTRCWTVKRHLPPHGPLNIVGALERSCNVYYYQIGQEMGLPLMSRWGARFGLGQPTGIELGGIEGRLPALATGMPWTPSQSRYLAIGQEELAVTPVQVARLMAVIANGGELVRPHVLRGGGCNERVQIRRETVDTIKRGLWEVVHGAHGTGATSGLNAFEVWGKTSSAQPGRDRDGNEREAHAWFSGFTKDAVVVVLVEFGGGGGLAAAPVAAKILGLLKP